jgi:hypothetical protein
MAWMKSDPKKKAKCRKMAVYKTACYEFRSHKGLGEDWLPAVTAVQSTYATTMTSKHLTGYVQKLEVGSSVQIATYCKDQFDCLAATEYSHRIIHADGTGNKVQIRQHANDVHKFVDQRKIINHTLMVRNASLVGSGKPHRFVLGK